jgi:hypothetical protein
MFEMNFAKRQQMLEFIYLDGEKFQSFRRLEEILPAIRLQQTGIREGHRWVTVVTAERRGFEEAAHAAGIRVMKCRESGPARLVKTYCCHESDYKEIEAGKLTEYAVFGGTRSLILSFPGAHKMRAEMNRVADFDKYREIHSRAC